MAVNLDQSQRDRESGTEAINISLQLGNVTEFDAVAGQGNEGFFLPFNIPGLDQPAFDIATVTTVSGNAQVTTTNDGFADVEPGDLVTGTGIAPGSLVVNKVDDNTLILDNAATANGTETIQFDPNGGNTIDPTFFGVEIQLARQGSATVVQVIFHRYDGTLQGVEGTNNNSSSSLLLKSEVVGHDPFYGNLRVPKSA